MKKLATLFLLLISAVSLGQELSKKQILEAKTQLKEGNKLFKEGKFKEATSAYEKSLQENQMYYKGAYNLGNSLFKQGKFKEALDQYGLANKLAKTKQEKAKTDEFIGDSYIAQKELEKAEQAYKKALLNNPSDDVLRQKYIATKKAKEQQQKDNKNQDKKDNKDGDKDKDQKDDKDGDKDPKDDKNKNEKDNKGDKGEDKENKDKDQKDDKDGDKDPKDDKNKKDGDKKDKDGKNNEESGNEPKPQPSKLSKQQIEQLLENMSNEEQKTQKKINAQKVKVKGKKNEKDW